MNTPQGNIVDSGRAFCMMRFPGDRRIFCTGFREDDLSQDERIEFLFNLYDNTGEVIKLPCTSIVDDYTGLTLEDFDKCYEISLDIESSEVHKKFDYSETTEDEHLEIVSDCVRFLSEASEDGVERKIVLSRTKLINMKRSELRDKLINLFESRKDALVFYYGLPELGTWFGASPEILLTRAGASIVSMSLAGTRLTGSNNEDWDIKNIIEQRIVTNEIKSVFELCGLNVSTEGPFTRHAGNVEHLCTLINSSAPAGFSNDDILGLAKRLSPTPALCGYPREMAADYIKRHELSDRECYGGFIGIEDYVREVMKLYVNLRSARYNPITQQVKAYIGGGITPLSYPTDEVAETCRKLRWLTGTHEKKITARKCCD